MNKVDSRSRARALVAPLLASAIAVAASAARLSAQEVNLQWRSSDVQTNLGSYQPNPQPVRLSTTKPAALKGAPEDAKAPLYGELKIGPKESQTAILIFLDETEGKPPRLLLDLNGNSDLADETPIKLVEQQSGSPGRETTTFTGGVTVKIPYAGGTKNAHLLLSRYGTSTANPGAFREMLFYSRDYALTGTVKLGEKSYPAALVDESASGDFRPAGGKSSSIRFLIDVDGDGRFDPRREILDAREPFNIGGTTYEITELQADGRFRLVKSSQTAAEIRATPNLMKGGKAPSFTARTTDDKEVKFPGDYKGKVVLVDFWATWCPPCVREVPNVVANYEKYHDKGFEILSVSLDRPNDEEKLTKFVKDHKMTWPQIFDTKGGPNRIAQDYGVLTIPFMLVVDGDTGEVLAGTEARGPNLALAIESGFAKKAAAKTKTN